MGKKKSVMSLAQRVLDVYFNGACPEGEVSSRHLPHLGETHITVSLIEKMEEMISQGMMTYEMMHEGVVTFVVRVPQDIVRAVEEGRELSKGWRKKTRMSGLMLPKDQYSYKEDGGWVPLRDPSKGWGKKSAEFVKGGYQMGYFW